MNKKSRRPIEVPESVREQSFWYIFFRITILAGLIVGSLNLGASILATLQGSAEMPTNQTNIILYFPYSFIGGFALGFVLVAWALIIVLACYELYWGIKGFYVILTKKNDVNGQEV